VGALCSLSVEFAKTGSRTPKRDAILRYLVRHGEPPARLLPILDRTRSSRLSAIEVEQPDEPLTNHRAMRTDANRSISRRSGWIQFRRQTR
jgi:hypothetical protein